MQIPMLAIRRLHLPRRTRGHVVDELVMLRIEPRLLTLYIERDPSPFGIDRAVKRAGAIEPALCRLYARGVALVACARDGVADLLLVAFSKSARLLNPLGQLVQIY